MTNTPNETERAAFEKHLTTFHWGGYPLDPGTCERDSRIATPDYAKYQSAYTAFRIARKLLKDKTPPYSTLIKALDDRIETYTNKHNNENGSVETRAELRFAIESLNYVKQSLPTLIDDLALTTDKGAAKVRELVNNMAMAFICEYCGLMPKHIGIEDIADFLNQKNTQAEPGAKALNAAIMTLERDLKKFAASPGKALIGEYPAHEWLIKHPDVNQDLVRLKINQAFVDDIITEYKTLSETYVQESVGEK